MGDQALVANLIKEHVTAIKGSAIRDTPILLFVAVVVCIHLHAGARGVNWNVKYGPKLEILQLPTLWVGGASNINVQSTSTLQVIFL